MTLKELSEHPELANEENLKSFYKSLKTIKEFVGEIKK